MVIVASVGAVSISLKAVRYTGLVLNPIKPGASQYRVYIWSFDAYAGEIVCEK